MKIKINEITDLYEKMLIKSGLSKEEADAITEERLYAQLCGKISHGFMNYEKDINVQSVPDKPVIVKESDCYARIDGKKGLGNLVANYALDIGIEKAKQKGIAIVGMKNMTSFYMPGTYARKGAERGMITFVTITSKARVAPYGGIDPVLGPDAIGIGMPGKPIVIDMANSVRAMAEIRLAKLQNKKLEKGLAIDENGKETIDPEKANALLPFGGYKGYALNLIFEILGSALIGTPIGKNKDGKLDRGCLFIIIDPSIFIPKEQFEKEVNELISQIKSSRKAEGVTEIYYPGERSERLKKENIKNGTVEVDDKILDKIKKRA